ncbi:hypothetical protein FN846DRAFT_293711 [Sphaerosporella brunnea]|uniref:Rhodopsin domain-containing protein n=1 Tax=Sphaerosporella brunnea TaxID=1250544 RepID=A0A5J5EM07_9PEZI|nr:hypothetical protein FN846DRAFT_293711 [Sphaerosporella brunnea]
MNFDLHRRSLATMVDAVGVTVALWVMQAANLVLLAGRLSLRIRRHKQSPKPSDYLMIVSFLCILTQTISLTYLNVDEVRFLNEHPDFPEHLDPLSVPVVGYNQKKRTLALKIFYALTFPNHLALWFAKATLLCFFYEIFPARFRKVLHVISAILAVAFLANIFESLFWCFPFRSMWEPVEGHGPSAGFCAQKLVSAYNSAQFGAHLSSTVVVVILPMLLLRSVGSGRPEAAFALSILGVGLLSIVASIATFVTLLRMRVYMLDLSVKHAAVLSTQADQCVLFTAACVSVFRFRYMNAATAMKRSPSQVEALEMSTNPPGLVIEVERSWSITVEIVEAWGHGWRDPWIIPNQPNSPREG